MRKLLKKEFRLSASPITFFFILFGLMFFLPGYPVLCGVFFVTLGLYQSFQNAREANDTVFCALLPVSKRDIVKGKFLFAICIEGSAFLLMAAAVAVRMTLLKDAAPYKSNALMNANPFALGAALLLFGLFNLIFIGGFYKTGYRLGRPFIAYAVTAFICIALAEAAHHVPGLAALNAFGKEHALLQGSLLAGGAALYALFTLSACKTACARFEKIDL